MTTEELGEQRAKELGLKKTNTCDWPLARNNNQPIYLSRDIHKLLGESYDVYAQTHFGKPKYWGPLEPSQYEDTHKGYVLGVRQIDQSSREEEMKNLLNDLVKSWDAKGLLFGQAFSAYMEKARALIERKP